MRAPSTPLVEAKDGRIEARIESVVLRNGPGSWTRDALWDEYRFRIDAASNEAVEIREIVIFDALDRRLEPRADRSALVAGTDEVLKRYAEQSTAEKLTAGDGMAAAMLSPIFAVGVVNPYTAAALVSLPVTVPLVLARHAKVNEEIQRRSTKLPVRAGPEAPAHVYLFFPLASPGASIQRELLSRGGRDEFTLTALSGRAQIIYADRDGEHRLDIDTRRALLELSPATQVSRDEPAFPEEARLAGVERGNVKANLTLDRQGGVKHVEILEAWPRYVFDEEARRTFRRWTYTPGREDGRVVRAILQFKRP